MLPDLSKQQVEVVETTVDPEDIACLNLTGETDQINTPEGTRSHDQAANPPLLSPT